MNQFQNLTESQVAGLRSLLEQQQQHLTEQNKRQTRQEEELALLKQSLIRLLAEGKAGSEVASAATPDTIEPEKALLPVREAPERLQVAGRQKGRRSSRRSLLKTVGAGAAALFATGMLSPNETITGIAGQAEAADGGNIIIGNTNTGSTGTVLNATSGALTGFLFQFNNQLSGFQGGGGLPKGGVAVVGLGGPEGYGVLGVGTGIAGIGLVGQGAGGSQGIDIYAGGNGRFLQTLQNTTGAPTTGSHFAGEQIRDSAGNLFICVASGTPGSWKQVATTEQGFHSFSSPRRVFGDGSTTSSGTTTAAISAVTSTGVPIGASSAFCAVQAIPTTSGPLTLFPDGTTDPGIANYSATTPGVNNLIYMLVPLSSAGKFKIHSYITAQIFVDVWGYLL